MRRIPPEWRIKDDYSNPKRYESNMTKAMLLVWSHLIPYKEYLHDPNI